MQKRIRDLKLDPVTGDISVTADGNIETVNLGTAAEFAEAMRQAARQRLLFFQGESHLNPDAGVPYFQSILGKRPSLTVLREIFREALTQTPGVKSVPSIMVTYKGSERALTISFSLETDQGLITSSETVGA